MVDKYSSILQPSIAKEDMTHTLLEIDFFLLNICYLFKIWHYLFLFWRASTPSNPTLSFLTCLS